MAIASAPPSTVSFPSTEPNSPYSPPPSSYLHRPPHLPFRRISLPSSPSLLNRQSVGSLASFDSLPEEQNAPGASMPSLVKNVVKKSKSRPTSLEVQRKSRKKDKDSRVDEAREAKRRKIIHEFYETERSYVDGLDLIYAHFLTPIIESLETSHPLLDRVELTSVFSNFIDIWNLHRAFFSSLSAYLNTSQGSPSPPPISPILLSHFPYLSMYTPFVTSFSTAIASLNTLLSSKPAFAAFVAQQEAHERCGRLKLRDWLLTVVQRCPRYLLLLKDLIGCTDRDDPEYNSLTAVHTLVSKITVSLNTSLHTHAQTLALLALQRSTPNLPPNFQLISPGRTFLKRAPLLQLDRSSSPKEREFLLFSDVLVWLASAERGDGQVDDWGLGISHSNSNAGSKSALTRPRMLRSRSKSEAELPTMKSSPQLSSSPGSAISPSPSKRKVARHASSGMEEKWVYKGHVDLVDLDVVVSPTRDVGDERRFEVLSPEASFAVYASSEEERDDWAAAIRNAKSSLLVSLNVMHPNSTLTSSSSTQHLRRTLQALPHLPEDGHNKPRRGKVEHFVPAIWIPDGKTESCMRCGRTFGWRRRRHHCRLCGRCVCGACSGSTFFISDPNAKDSNKPARACGACYETVFPILENDSSPTNAMPPAQTIGTLSGFPSWQSISMPSLALSGVGARASALMAIDLGSPKRPLEAVAEGESGVVTLDDGSEVVVPPLSRLRSRASNRPKSYVQILEDFQEQGMAASPLTSTGPRPGPEDSTMSLAENEQDIRAGDEEVMSTAGTGSAPTSPRKEDTARRHKRFSLPVVALQTTAVTARPTEDPKSKRFSLVLNGRSSHAHGHGHHGHVHSTHHHHVQFAHHGHHGQHDNPSEVNGKSGGAVEASERKDPGLRGGAAAVKLNELLGKARAS
ncbi:hypothetical protein GLOTRDRAFT_67584 [Gloeophyllum trabeum ATCC 11539]|uniref:Dbl homology domain-containing protein n=1 Tax=Gloeophyllum trabeum (strain ATCC 11539 / FP-39264 / Madison 617) TaxID=670483 RepID=S7QLF5_GLOTA|nr:uncharacterized protein GLOTRDRAFT_67584 [Gloeophyllum trabeum ATCC 11539]EPQ60193.1 hypothetical protein GLOTRDRAFT_67584 [Gloeophyllum trabeum ATCC 11539]